MQSHKKDTWVSLAADSIPVTIMDAKIFHFHFTVFPNNQFILKWNKKEIAGNAVRLSVCHDNDIVQVNK